MDKSSTALYNDAMTTDLTALTEADLVDPEPRFRGINAAVLPFGNEYGKWNPLDPEAHPFGADWLAGGVVYVLRRVDLHRDAYATRTVASAGLLGDSWRVGNIWRLRHDQTNAALGEYRVVGIVLYGDDGEVVRTAGEVTSLKLRTATFK